MTENVHKLIKRSKTHSRLYFLLVMTIMRLVRYLQVLAGAALAAGGYVLRYMFKHPVSGCLNV